MKKPLLFFFSFMLSIAINAQSEIKCFNGVDQSENLGRSIGNGLRTIEMWFKLNEPIDPTLSNFSTLVAREISGHNNKDEFSFSFQPKFVKNPGTLRFDIDGKEPFKSVYSDNNTWEANRWYHVAAVIHPEKGMMLFLDGKLQQRTHPHTQATAKVTAPTVVGKWGDLDMRYFNGCIRGLEISKEALYAEDFDLFEPLAKEPQKREPQHSREVEEEIVETPVEDLVVFEPIEQACKCDYEPYNLPLINIDDLIIDEEEIIVQIEEVIQEEVTPVEVETKQTEIEELTEPGVKVYPNPSAGIFNFQFENLNDPTAQVRIYNMVGQLITSIKVQAVTVVNLESEVTGTYVYQVVGATGVLKTGQLIKQ